MDRPIHRSDLQEDRFDALLGETSFLYGYRQDWNDTLEILADEHPISSEKISTLRKYGRLLSKDGPIRTTEKSNFSLMILTQMIYDADAGEAVDGDYLFMMINELRKNTKTLWVRSWLAPEHALHPELTMHSLIKSFDHLAGLRRKYPSEVRRVKAIFSESNWYLAQGLSRIGYDVKARKLPKPALGDDGTYDFHEYIVEFSKI